MNKQKRSDAWKPLATIGAVLAAFGGKLKFLIPILKFGKVGGTIWSMALMIGSYALFYPWTFAIGIVLMLFIHEMGHVWAAKRKGLPVSAPAFIPFMGALITMKKMPEHAETEAYIAYGGPLLGSLGAVAALGAAVVTGYEPLYAVAQIGFFLNLINLLPIHPLDGGRIVTAISRWLWIVGLIGGLVVIVYLKAFIFFLFWALFAWELYKKYVRKKPAVTHTAANKELVVDRSPFEEVRIVLPSEHHHRELLFLQYCRLHDRQQLCAVWYTGVGQIGNFRFEVGHIEKVELMRTKWDEHTGTMNLKITYEPYPEYRRTLTQEEEYYRVSSSVRIIYGVAYFGLAAALGLLMYVTAVLIRLPVLAF